MAVLRQQQLWHETYFDAIHADIEACGGFKVVANKLWPTLGVETAAAKLRNALNPEQAQKLGPDELLAIKSLAWEAGSHAALRYESRALGFEYTAVSPENERDRLQREFIEMGKRMQQLVGQLNQLDTRTRGSST